MKPETITTAEARKLIEHIRGIARFLTDEEYTDIYCVILRAIQRMEKEECG